MPGRKSHLLSFSVWPTAWGPVGGVWGAKGLQRLVLPHYQADDLAELLAWEHQGASRDEAPFERLADLTQEYFNGRPVEFSEIPCDLPGNRSFGGLVLRACRQVGYGQRSTYGQLARQIGRPEAARAVAGSLGRNPVPLIVPCHRITYADGSLGGFSAPGGVEVKRRMLALESAGPTG